MISYSRRRLLSKDPIKVAKRGVKGEARQIDRINAIEDALSSPDPQKPPYELAGLEMPKPTENARELIKVVNELKKQNPDLFPESSTGARSPLETAKDPYRNAMIAMQRDFNRGYRVVDGKTEISPIPNCCKSRRTGSK